VSTSRLLPLEGGRNFRDLGGYLTAGGHWVRRGRLYRSGVLTYLTAADHRLLADRGIRVICDLRTQRERQREPSQWPDANAVLLAWDYDPRHTSLRHYLDTETDITPEAMRRCMLKLYRHLPGLLRPQYAALFAQLAADRTPVLFHCSAGKDRTGIAAALILSLLGVPREAIVADYALTNECVDLEEQLQRRRDSSLGVGDNVALFPRLDRATRRPLIDASPDYLLAALEQIERDRGSVDTYLREDLGVSADTAATIRASLLEA
jgi:protein-tyrosine phosphatase